MMNSAIIRKKKNLTQHEVADTLNISVNYVKKLEKNEEVAKNIKYNILEAFSNFYEVSVDELLIEY